MKEVKHGHIQSNFWLIEFLHKCDFKAISHKIPEHIEELIAITEEEDFSVESW